MLALTLRVPDELHAVARMAAAAQRQSLHAYILAALRAAVLRDGARDTSVAAAIERHLRAEEPR